MNTFRYKAPYLEEGKKVLEVNILPEKYCNFDCVFCPIGRSKNKTDQALTFTEMDEALADFSEKLRKEPVDLVFINSAGEAFVNDQLKKVIILAKAQGIPVRLLTNGYLLGDPTHRETANLCEEVLGEIKVASNEDFIKLQRPIPGYTLDTHIENMVSFRTQYHGKFLFEITIVKGYNDSPEAIEKTKAILRKLRPDKLFVISIEDEPFKAKLGLSDEALQAIREELMAEWEMLHDRSEENTR